MFCFGLGGRAVICGLRPSPSLYSKVLSPSNDTGKVMDITFPYFSFHSVYLVKTTKCSLKLLLLSSTFLSDADLF